MIVERENAALMYGIELPVSPHDNDSLHIPMHVEAINFVQQQDPASIAEQQLTTAALEKHIEEHQQSAQQKASALGNSKDLGGNSGQMVNAEAGAITQPSTTQAVPSTGRRRS
jgi:hypothetical protein